MSIGNGAPAWPSVIVSNGRISRSEHIRIQGRKVGVHRRLSRLRPLRLAAAAVAICFGVRAKRMITQCPVAQEG